MPPSRHRAISASPCVSGAFLSWVSRLPNDQQQQVDLTNAAIAASRVGS
jgi:hypothetical protein